MILSARTEANLVGVNPGLVQVWLETPLIPECSRAEVVEGVRTFEKQQHYVKTNKSKILNSRHLTGDAFDFALYRDEDGDGDEDFVKAAFPLYEKQWKLFQETGKRLGIKLDWGGYWSMQDGMHIQASWEQYPISPNQKTVPTSKTIAAAGAGIPIAAFVPDILAKLKELVGSLSFLDASWISGIQIGLLLFIAGYIVLERKKKLDQEGV